MIQSKKATLFYVLEILKKYSDEEHFLSQQDILDYMSKNYDIELDRKTVGATIQLLEDLEFDIIRGPGNKGYALGDRILNPTEIRYIIDAIFSSRGISASEARNITNKLYEELSIYQKKSYKYLYKSSDVNRTINKQVFYNLSVIDYAIRNNKWIGFKYCDIDMNNNLKPRKNGYIYHVSPCYLVNNYGQYYLLGKRSNYKNIIAFRLDRMIDVEEFDRERMDPSTLEEFKYGYSISDYLNDHVYLFGGELTDCKVKLENESAVSYVKDYFGKNAFFSKNEQGDIIVDIKANESAIFLWCKQYANVITVLQPNSLKNKLLEHYKNELDKYK